MSDYLRKIWLLLALADWAEPSIMRSKHIHFLLVCLVSLLLSGFYSSSSHGQNLDPTKKYALVNVGFYNLENLFDTIIDPDTTKILRDEFTPGGANNWTYAKYKEKLANLAEVISQMGIDISPDGIAVLGVSEIENRGVLEDLVKTEKLKKFGYEIVHYDSPDRRGVDVGLLYQPKYFQVTSSSSHRLSTPDDPNFISRDQLLVTGLLDGEEIHFMVSHWPSRRGGEKRSAPKRIAAALLGRSIIDSLQAINPKARVIYMGDLNDDPNNESVRKYLCAGKKVEKLALGCLFNTMEDLFDKGIGTLAWRDSWNLFDQMLVTQELLNEQTTGFRYYRSKVFNKPFLIQKSGAFEGYPFRTFSGGAYIGGYSDHFPVYTILVKEI